MSYFRVFALDPTYPFDEVVASDSELDRVIALYHKLHPEIPVYWHPVIAVDSNQPKAVKP